MEFLRFGSSIPGAYWGCCAMDVIQGFSCDPDDKASIQLVEGDGGQPLTNDKGFMFAGPTNKDIFLQRIRYGTFGAGDMPNHGFLAILTGTQISSKSGKAWLKIMKEVGFEFIRTVDNSVYTGSSVLSEPGPGTRSAHPNYLFGLFRNIGKGAVEDPFTPPKEWTDLPSVVPEVWEHLNKSGVELNLAIQAGQLTAWEGLPKKNFLSEEEVEKAGAPVIYAGMRSKFPQQPRDTRKQLVELEAKKKPSPSVSDPFAPKMALSPVPASDFEACEDDFDDFDDWGEYSEDEPCQCEECLSDL